MTARSPLVLLVTLAALTVGLPSAPASASDLTSTQAYLQANYKLVQYADAHIPRAEASLKSVLAGVRHECPRVAAESPQDTNSEQLSNEVIGTMVTTIIKPGLQVARSFVRAAAPLRWSNRGLTRTIQAYAAKVNVLSKLAIPHLCADVKAWVASGFNTLPATTVHFDRVFMPAWVGAGELPASLSAYEPAEDRALVRRTVQLEEKWADFEARAVESWGSIMDEMVLQP
jgi:hypothetical protein